MTLHAPIVPSRRSCIVSGWRHEPPRFRAFGPQRQDESTARADLDNAHRPATTGAPQARTRGLSTVHPRNADRAVGSTRTRRARQLGQGSHRRTAAHRPCIGICTMVDQDRAQLEMRMPMRRCPARRLRRSCWMRPLAASFAIPRRFGSSPSQSGPAIGSTLCLSSAITARDHPIASLRMTAGPQRAGRPRHGEPVLNTPKMPLNTLRPFSRATPRLLGTKRLDQAPLGSSQIKARRDHLQRRRQ